MARGQSAIEFLMTYGWAILIMLTVVAILFYLGVFNPRTVAPKACTLPAGFSCFGYRIYSTDGARGNLTLDLSQATGHTVNITEIACSANDTPSFTPVNVRIYNGEHEKIYTNCYYADGSLPQADDFYRGSIYIRYLDEDTNIEHRIRGDISYNVERE